MLIAGDALAKTLDKSKKVNFWNKEIVLDVFIFANCWRCSYGTILIHLKK